MQDRWGPKRDAVGGDSFLDRSWRTNLLPSQREERRIYGVSHRVWLRNHIGSAVTRTAPWPVSLSPWIFFRKDYLYINNQTEPSRERALESFHAGQTLCAGITWEPAEYCRIMEMDYWIFSQALCCRSSLPRWSKSLLAKNGNQFQFNKPPRV